MPREPELAGTRSPLLAHPMTERLPLPRRTRSSRERGLSMVEMAFLVPLLLLLMIGVGDFGRIMYHGITLTHAARSGAAYGSQSTAHMNDAAGIRAPGIEGSFQVLYDHAPMIAAIGIGPLFVTTTV